MVKSKYKRLNEVCVCEYVVTKGLSQIVSNTVIPKLILNQGV